eukprot:COSAG06_NODE_11147_length_1556_cov_1.905971_1_plen_262_part_10
MIALIAGGPTQSYYTDPTPDGACQSTTFGTESELSVVSIVLMIVSSLSWQTIVVHGYGGLKKGLSSAGLVVSRCSTASAVAAAEPAWTFDTTTGFLAAGGAARGKCLSAVGPRQTNNVALTAKLSMPTSAAGGGGATTPPATDGGLRADEGGAGAGAGAGSAVAKQRVQLKCGVSVQLTIGVATERDAPDDSSSSSSSSSSRGGGGASYTKKADQLASVSSTQAAALHTEHEAWWHKFWNASSVRKTASFFEFSLCLSRACL